jgi:hypothetical protein
MDNLEPEDLETIVDQLFQGEIFSSNVHNEMIKTLESTTPVVSNEIFLQKLLQYPEPVRYSVFCKALALSGSGPARILLERMQSTNTAVYITGKTVQVCVFNIQLRTFWNLIHSNALARWCVNMNIT